MTSADLSAEAPSDTARRCFDEGVGRFRAGDYPTAEAHFRRALELTAPRASVLTNLANALLAQGKASDAASFALRSVELEEGGADGWFVLGRCLLGEPEQALVCFDHAIARRPDWAMARFMRASVLVELQRPTEALSEYDASIRLDPSALATWLDRGVLLFELKRYPEALACYAQAQKLSPENADAHWNEAHLRLLLGQFELGWAKYAYRWKYTRAERARYVERPLQSLEQAKPGSRVLLWAEQGYGDTIQFCRYAKQLADRGTEVFLEVQAPLKELVGSLGVRAIYAHGEGVPQFDFQAAILDLPQLFGGAPKAIRWPSPYLSADPQLVASWRARLGADDRRLRIGLSCSGNAHHVHDRRRSMPLAALAQLSTHARFYLIQKELRDDDAVAAASLPDLQYLGHEVRTFADSAAIVANMDLVISVDTALAHLAGALGKTVWILLPWTPDWRWMLDRTDSPWYPTATLFRQDSDGDWDGVIRRVGLGLEGLGTGS